MVHEAGAVVVGGHTVIDDEVKFGLAVTGLADPSKLLTNAGALAGDSLVLTKPVGNGMIATAAKQGSIPHDVLAEMVRHMVTLNALASREALRLGVRCATDITGFGVLGHASHIARASNVTLRIEAQSVPALGGAEAAFRAGALTAGARRNTEYIEPLVRWGAVSAYRRALLTDPQTSGGLLVVLPEARVPEYLASVPGSVRIGDVGTREDVPLVVD